MNSDQTMVIKLSIKVLIVIVVAFLAGLIFVENPLNYAKGLAFGGIFTILKIKLMQMTFKKALNKPSKSAMNYTRIQYMVRYLLTGVVIVVAVLEPSIHFIGVIIGLLSMKAAAYWQGFLEKPTPKDGSIQFLEWEDDEEESSDF